MVAGCAQRVRPIASPAYTARLLARHRSRLVASPTVPDVLIATDADWIHAEVDAALADETMNVLRVRTGAEVPAAVAEHQPLLVVLDLQIGNMGGIATLIHLRQEAEEGRLPAAPILLLLDRPADVPLARGVGADGWLIKPLDGHRLRRAAQTLHEGNRYQEPSGLAAS